MELFRRHIHAPTTESSGGIPEVNPDAIISAVLMAVYIAIGATHLSILIRNKKRGKKFGISGMAFGLCNVRIITFTLRIAWTTVPRNVSLGLASTSFVYAGTILLYCANLIFMQRIVRAQHPSVGWSKAFSLLVPALFAGIIITIVIIIAAVVDSFFAYGAWAHHVDRSLQLYGLTFYAVVSFLPIPIVIISSLAGQLPSVKAERALSPIVKFGQGRMVHKVLLVVFTAAMLTLGTAFRAGTTYLPLVQSIPTDGATAHQKWYLSKAAFYCFNFGIEIIVLISWLVWRIDIFFHIPDGAKGTYAVDTTSTEGEAEKVLTTPPENSSISVRSSTCQIQGLGSQNPSRLTVRNSDVPSTVFSDYVARPSEESDCNRPSWDAESDPSIRSGSRLLVMHPNGSWRHSNVLV